MKRFKKVLFAISVIAVISCIFCQPAFAISESEVQAQVDAVGREAVTGNVFIWFLCAVAFLKVSQKIDSFMSSLGINVGHTGGSMLAEAMIAARGVGAVKGFAGRGFGGGGHSDHGGQASSGGSGGSGGFMSGGLAGVVSRQINNNAVKSATSTAPSSSGGLGGRIFASSMSKGGDFANNVIGTVAQGNIASVGSMRGEEASQALLSYMGYTALGEGATDMPSFSGVEIGGGRITGTEVNVENPGGVAFGMYHADQYAAPEGAYSTIQAVDGSTWYKQYAADTVEKSPYMAPDGSIAYHESITKKLPPTPRRKDKI